MDVSKEMEKHLSFSARENIRKSILINSEQRTLVFLNQYTDDALLVYKKNLYILELEN